MVLELTIVMFLGDFLSLLIDLFGLEIGMFDISLAFDVPFLDAFYSLVLGLKQFIGE